MDESRSRRPDPKDSFVPSLLDRLIVPPSAGAGPSMGFGLNQLIESVRRDMEDLLNTHQTHHDIPAEFVELRKSILAYGVPDFPSESVSRSQAQRVIGNLIEGIVNRYEPRLKDVRAIPADESAAERQGLNVRIHIEARLRADPFPDVSFESVIELTSGKTSIRRGE
jgi:type VI secretion system protein ImpF